MQNEVLILKLVFEEGEVEQVEPSALAHFVTSFEGLTRILSSMLNMSQYARLYLVASKSGSLDLHFRIDISKNDQNREPGHMGPLERPPKQEDFLNRLSQLASVGSFLVALAAAPGGVLSSYTSPSKTTSADEEHEFIIAFAEQNSGSLTHPANAVIDAALKLKAKKLILMAPGYDQVIIISGDENRVGTIASRPPRNFDKSNLRLNEISLLNPSSPVEVNFKGQRYKAFLAQSGQHQVVAVWASQRLPHDGLTSNPTYQVRADIIRAEEVEPVGEVPPSYRTAAAILFIRQINFWE